MAGHPLSGTVPIMETVEPEETDDEATRIVKWRALELERAGVDEVLAMVLATDDGVDLHQARTMAKAGCPQELLRRILL